MEDNHHHPPHHHHHHHPTPASSSAAAVAAAPAAAAPTSTTAPLPLPSDLHHPPYTTTSLAFPNNASSNNPPPHSLSLSLPGLLPSSNPRSIPPLKALPFPPPPDRHSREDCWSEGATNTLIDAWGDRYLDLNRGNLKQKHWKDVADTVNARENGMKSSKTDVQCKNRLDTLKKKYKLEKSKIVTGGGPSKWTFYERLDELIGPSKKQKKPSPVKIIPNEKQPADESLQKAVLLNDANAQELVFHNDMNANINTQLLNSINNLNNNIMNNNNKNNNTTNTNTNNHNTTTDTISRSKESPDMTDSCPHGLLNGPDGKPAKKKRLFDGPFKDLARAILKFGEVYERVESAKQQQLMDLERQRMEFTKDLELQRMHLFMQTQLELAKMKHGKHGSTEHYI